jgi:hypothetical protein
MNFPAVEEEPAGMVARRENGIQEGEKQPKPKKIFVGRGFNRDIRTQDSLGFSP